MSSESPNSRKADARLPETPWYQRLNLLNTTLLIFMLAVIFSGTQIEGNERDLDVWQNLGRFLADFFPSRSFGRRSNWSCSARDRGDRDPCHFFCDRSFARYRLGCRTDHRSKVARRHDADAP